eukprot:2371336-Lingulodinium_polyedra.AAC.2
MTARWTRGLCPHSAKRCGPLSARCKLMAIIHSTFPYAFVSGVRELERLRSSSPRNRGIVIQDEARQFWNLLSSGGEVFNKATFVKLFGASAWKRTVGPSDKKFRMSDSFLAVFGACHAEDLETYFGSLRAPKDD